MDRAAPIIRHFRHVHGIPLLCGPLRPGEAVLDPDAILAVALEEQDARLVMATALWLSLVDPRLRLDCDRTGPDRRRIAYLAEIARCLGLLRGESARRRDRNWPARVARTTPLARVERVALFPSAAPPLPASVFGRRWNIVEVIPFSEYAAFQRKFLTRRTAGEAA